MKSQDQIIAPPEGRIYTISLPIEGEAPREIILLNFPDRFIGGEYVIAWGEEQHLRPVAPSICLGIGESILHDLNIEIATDFMAVIALDPQRQKAYGVQWKLAERVTILPSFYGAFSSEAWFAFECIPVFDL